MDDFPAAHSMDTTWFAVDRDGHVASFDSGEAGAVPTGAFAGNEAYALRERLARFLPRGEAAYDLAGRQIPGTEGKPVWHRAAGGRELDYPALLFLKSLDPVQEALASGQAVQVTCGDSFAVRFQHLPAELGKRIHDAGACEMCFYLFREVEREDPGPARLGFFEYEHLTENWISGPYGRIARPLKPLHVDQLPPDLRARVKRLRFDNLSFVQTTHIQPVEHAECDSWEGAYLDVTGKKVRPIPGREGRYADAISELQDLTREGVEFEPPGAAGGGGAGS
jgi:hypothetical protein